MNEAITIWVDESTEIEVGEDNYNLIGYLITDSGTNEDVFRAKLRALRRNQRAWKTLHGNEIDPSAREMVLLDKWLQAFMETEVYFHVFFYKRDGRYIRREETYEDYFARQSVFALAYKMKGGVFPINKMFEDVSTLRVIFDRRREHIADITVRSDGDTTIERLHELENVYKNAIGEKIKEIASKDYNSDNFTIRFSFVADECFNLMQFSDTLLYLVRKKIEQDITGVSNEFTDLFDKHFLDGLKPHTRNLGYRKIYEYDKKFNFFESKSNNP